MRSTTIEDVEAIHLRLPAFDAGLTDGSRDVLLIRVTVTDGTIGWGEVDSCAAIAKAAVETGATSTISRGLRELLLGRNALDVRRLWHDMYESTVYHGRDGACIQAMAGIDLALWDVAGKVYGEPVSRLLGGAHRTSIRAYASNLFGQTPAETAQRARSAVDAGFAALKFGWAPFGSDPALDDALLQAVRDEVGMDVELAVDVGLVWDSRTARSRARALEHHRLWWLEEPLHPDDLRGYRSLSKASPIPIAAGEEECTRRGMLRLMDHGRIDIVQIDVTRTGLTQAMLIAEDAATRGLRVANHSYTTDLNSAASLHLLAAIPNAIAFEYSFGASELGRAVVPHGLTFVDGCANVPDGPGLGVEPDRQAVERYRWSDSNPGDSNP